VLYNVDGQKVSDDAHQENFEAWRARLPDEDYDRMVSAINAYCDGKACFCTSYVPNEDSQIDRAFAALDRACGGDRVKAGMFFGNIVWRVIAS